MIRREYGRSSSSVEVNLTPMIDVVFLLLIFFMVTTVFVEEVGIEIQKPKAASAQMLEKKSILIGVSADGRVIYGNREIGVGGVRGLVSRLLSENKVPVIILVDESCKSGIVVDVIDECKLAGAKQVSIATQME